ncbi:hypothetical protein [Alloscardovia sp. HMSC034E08]|uniref:hypothetical protein n=1 Tax=Alloscardovia sp. HMSC034E08 TaxID=1739413 RepID=UPI0008D1F0FE|nr:hypothetical protein [Alloscardovia sp. HMSC034E08]OFR00077.1 hypothetical protein HMPREF2909_04930 [Alloscardovia sp. HMSC034E08]
MKRTPNHIEPLWPSAITLSVIVLAVIFAWFDHVDWATYLFAAFAFLMGLWRVLARDKAPWKIRSVAFDAFISFGLSIGLVGTYISIMAL